MKIHDVIALKSAMPEHNLEAGQVGTIVEVWQPDVFEVEFSNNDGIPYAFAAVDADNLIVLHFEQRDKRAS